MANNFIVLLPLIAAYLAKVVKNLEREGKPPPAADVNGLVWMVGCCLEAGVHLVGLGLYQCELSEIEALMKDRAKFRDSNLALALREAVRVVLLDLSNSPGGRSASVKAIKGIDLDNFATPKPCQPKLSFKPAHSMTRLALYELINTALDLDGAGTADSLKALMSFLRRTYLDLPRTDRRIVGLRAIISMSWDDIAKETRIPRTSASRRYDATLKFMASALDAWIRRNSYDSTSRS